MCGIAGFFSTRPLPDNTDQVLSRMLTRIRHRGPDGEGSHIDNANGLAFGHARLSIIDLETGAQPLYDRERKNVLTVNGEFYDYKRIRGDLTLQGARFKTKSDSEIALHLYEREGLEFVHHLRGEFGFVLYDAREDRLVLVRDRFGIKPLFFHVADDTIYYGSEVKALLAHPDVPARMSRQAALHQLMHTMVPGTTAFEDIHALKPGHMLIVSRSNGNLDIKEHCYWDLDFPERDGYDDSLSEDDHIEAVQSKLLESVQLRLEADVPVGCYLSGGIDSCSMLGMASSVQQSPVKAFTISFDHDAYDESDIAVEMAKRTQADHDILNLTAEELYGDNYRKTVWHSERTFYNTLGVAKWCMSRHVHEAGYKVVVTGEGSDELFGGYPAFKKDMLLHETPEDEAKRIFEAMDKSNALFKGAILPEDQESHPALNDTCGFTPSWIQSWMQTLKVARPLLHDDVLDELSDYDPIEAIAETFDIDRIRNRHALDIAQYTWSKTMLEGQILNWGGDRVDMANSMESRPAFLDHHVAETATMIPPKYRIRGNTEKWVLREAMRSVLPEVLYKREKFAFMAPPGHTEEKKRIALRELLDNHMNDEKVDQAGLFDVKRLHAFVEEYKVDKDPVSLVRKDAIINHLLCLHLLHEHFVANSSMAAAATG